MDLIPKNWFNNYLFNSENFSICVIYLIKFVTIFKIFHCVSGHMDVK
jgi:hypothetical protein